MVGDGPAQRLFNTDIQLCIQTLQTYGSHARHIFLNNGIVDLPRRDSFHQINAVEAVTFNNINGISNLIGQMLQKLDFVTALR